VREEVLALTYTAHDKAALSDTATYIYSAFPIVEREEQAAYGRYLSRDLCLYTLNALAAGDPDATIGCQAESG
jgi:hypothetical protein